MCDQALQHDQLDDVPRVVRGLQHVSGLARDVPRGVEVSGEVGEVSLRPQDRAVRGVPFQGQPGDRRARGVEVAGEARGPRKPGPDQAVLGPAGDRDRLLICRDGQGIAEREQQVTAAGEQPGQFRRPRIRPDGLDERQAVPVGAERTRRLDRPQDVGHRPRRETGGEELPGDPARRSIRLRQRLGDLAQRGRLDPRGHGLHQGVAEESVPEAVAGLGPLDEHPGESRPRAAGRPRPRPRPDTASSSSVVNVDAEQGQSLEGRRGRRREVRAGRRAPRRQGRGPAPAP